MKPIQRPAIGYNEPLVAPEGMALSADRLVSGDVAAVAAYEPLLAPAGMAISSGQKVAAHVPTDRPVADEGQLLVARVPTTAGEDAVAALVSEEARKLAAKLPPNNV